MMDTKRFLLFLCAWTSCAALEVDLLNDISYEQSEILNKELSLLLKSISADVIKSYDENSLSESQAREIPIDVLLRLPKLPDLIKSGNLSPAFLATLVQEDPLDLTILGTVLEILTKDGEEQRREFLVESLHATEFQVDFIKNRIWNLGWSEEISLKAKRFQNVTFSLPDVSSIALISIKRLSKKFLHWLKLKNPYIWDLNEKEIEQLKAMDEKLKLFEEESHQTSESLIEIKRALSEEERCLPRLRPALKTWMRKFQMREKYETFTLTDLFKSLG